LRHRITVPGSSRPWSNHAAEHVIQDTVFKRETIKRKKLRLLAHFTQDDAVTLHSVDTVPSCSKGKDKNNVKIMSLHHCKTFHWPHSLRFFMYKTANSILSTANTALTTKNTTENNSIMSHALNMITLSPNVFFNWNTSVTGHNQWAVGSPQRNALSRPNANSTNTMCTQNARMNLY